MSLNHLFCSKKFLFFVLFILVCGNGNFMTTNISSKAPEVLTNYLSNETFLDKNSLCYSKNEKGLSDKNQKKESINFGSTVKIKKSINTTSCIKSFGDTKKDYFNSVTTTSDFDKVLRKLKRSGKHLKNILEHFAPTESLIPKKITTMQSHKQDYSSKTKRLNPDIFIQKRPKTTNIQDIITGIVQLLNNNINIQTNTQAYRPLMTSRINNRGPPKISEVHPMASTTLEKPTNQLPQFDIKLNLTRNNIADSYQNSSSFKNPSEINNLLPISGYAGENYPLWQRVESNPTKTRHPPSPDEFDIPIEESKSKEDTTKKTSSNIFVQKHKINIKDSDTVFFNREHVSSTAHTTTLIESNNFLNSIQYANNNFLTALKTPALQDVPSLLSSIVNLNVSTTNIMDVEHLNNSSENFGDNFLSSSKVIHLFDTKKSTSYHPRPGIVLDDLDFKPSGHRKNLNIKTHNLAQNFTNNDIFDLTLSAVQNLENESKMSPQIIHIKPYRNHDIEYEDNPSKNVNRFHILPDTKSYPMKEQKHNFDRNSSLMSPLQDGEIFARNSDKYFQNIRTPLPTVRIDTCIVGDDTTCDQIQNEKCRTENGVSSCYCPPGYSRRKHYDPCRRIVSFLLSMRVDKIYDKKIIWDNKLINKGNEHHMQLSFESIKAITSAISMTPFSDEFVSATVNNIFKGSLINGHYEVFVNMTLQLVENTVTLHKNLKDDIHKQLLGAVHRRNKNIGNSVLYVESMEGFLSHLQDLNECQTDMLNDCNTRATCINNWGSFRCECKKGFRDPWYKEPLKSGKICETCSDAHCNNRGVCNYDVLGAEVCACQGNYYGSQCEIDGEVIGVAIGATLSALVIITLTLVCLIMWSRKWNHEQKHAIISSGFVNVNGEGVVKAIGFGYPEYEITSEDRLGWTLAKEIQAKSILKPTVENLIYPQIPNPTLRRYFLNDFSNRENSQTALSSLKLQRPDQHFNGQKTHTYSSASEEEDRIDLIERNFYVPRSKSSSNHSIVNQSAIYCDLDVDYASSNGYEAHDIPMSTYKLERTHQNFCCQKD